MSFLANLFGSGKKPDPPAATAAPAAPAPTPMEEKRTALEIERLNAQMEAKILEQENKEMTEKEKAQACLLRKDAAGESLHSAKVSSPPSPFLFSFLFCL
jgi:hypothetical protein